MSRAPTHCLSRFSPSRPARPTRRSSDACVKRSIRMVSSLVGAALTALVISLLSANASAAVSFNHGAWDSLLQDCVVPTPTKASTAANYDCFASRKNELDAYLNSLSAVSSKDFAALDRSARLAFLINAYNAWTVDLILTEWPDLESIKDLGSFIRSPWKKAFIPLFGERLSLDDIEHGMIRKPGAYNDPRIHFAVNCASVGCPALRREAYRSETLDAQLDDQTRQFLGDTSRNRYEGGQLMLSPIFKWYKDDFVKGWQGSNTLVDFISLYADALGVSPRDVADWKTRPPRVSHLSYDWDLNSATGS